MATRPGKELANRPLHVFWICDCSDSMKVDGKIQSLNTAIESMIPSMRDVADENPNVEVLIRAIKFSDGAQWHISQPTPVADFKWTDLTAGGARDMGKALAMVAEQLKIPPMPERALPPVLVLVSDGQPTDDFASGLKALMDQPWGKRAVRIAIAIGSDADIDVLERFMANPELKPLEAKNSETLTKYIRWVTTGASRSASSPATHSAAAPPAKTNLPMSAPLDDGSALGDVW